MKSQSTETPTNNAADEEAIRAILRQMIDAWNRGNGEAFAAPFAENADFVVFEGTRLKGRQEIASFSQRIFDTVMKGSRLEGEVKFVRFLSPQMALLHSVNRATLPGETEPSPGHDSMQLYVVTKRDGEWRAEGLLNARIVTLERQYFLDDVDALPAEDQRQVTDLVASLKRRRQAKKGPGFV